MSTTKPSTSKDYRIEVPKGLDLDDRGGVAGQGSEETVVAQAAEQDGHGGVGPPGGEQRGARFVGGQVHAAVFEQAPVKGGREFARRLDGDDVLHGHHGGHAGSDQPGTEPGKGVGGGAGGALAGDEGDQSRLVMEAFEHGGQFVVEQTPRAPRFVLHIEGSLSALGAESAVADKVQHVAGIVLQGLS